MEGNSATYVAFGIDLGTTNSLMAGCLTNGQVRICENAKGGCFTPSAVLFHGNQCMIGEDAMINMHRSPQTGFYVVKRIIGKTTDDKNIKDIVKKLTYKVDLAYKIPGTDKIDNRPRLPFDLPGYDIPQELFPEHISAIILNYLLESAKIKSSIKINDVVITVPANFNDYQRRATIDAGHVAGYNVLDVLSEPTAAAIYYAMKINDKNKDQELKEQIMVFDFGGGTLDVSIVDIDGYKFTVLATAGDTECGGKDIDDGIFKYVSEELLKRHGYDIEDPKNISEKVKLVQNSEQCKKNLVSTKSYEFVVANSFKFTIYRAKLDYICEGLEKKFIDTMEKSIRSSKLEKEDIKSVILVGGSSNLPCVTKIINEYMGFKAVRENVINPSEAIAMGAAYYGAFLKNPDSFNGKKIEVVDVTPMAIGIGVKGSDGQRIVHKFVERNVPRPYTSNTFFFKGSKGATSVSLDLYEGDERLQKDCHLIERNDIDIMEVNSDGIPQISVCIVVTKESINMQAVSGSAIIDKKIRKDKAAHTELEIEQMKRDIVELMRPHEVDDDEEDEKETPAEEFKKWIRAKKKDVMQKSEYKALAKNKKKKKDFADKSDRFLKWADKNKGASFSEVETKKLEYISLVKAFTGIEVQI